MNNGYPRNFSPDEFSCKCNKRYCDGDSPNPASTRHLAWVLQRIRDELGGKSIHINSGVRCLEWNKQMGGSLNSYHRKGMAADLDVEDASPEEVGDVIERLMDSGKIPNGGLGRYPTFTHVDLKHRPSRWGSND